MNELLVKAMLWAALGGLGVGWLEISGGDLMWRGKLRMLEARVIRIEWRPISVFPEEGRRFGKGR